MGHLMLWVLHLVAALAFWPGLLVTVPLHLVYAAMKRNERRRQALEPSPRTHVRCPDCKTLVHKEARKCAACGAGLVPASEQPAGG